MSSRTYRTCERIMEAVVKAGFIKQVPKRQLVRIIKRVAGGDKRTVEAYLEHLVDFEFLEDLHRRTVPIYEINLVKLDYAQTRLDELVQSRKVIAERK